MLRSVLLPLPFVPMSPILRPASICHETSWRTGTPANVFTRCSTRMSVIDSSLIHASRTRQGQPPWGSSGAPTVGDLPFRIARARLAAYNRCTHLADILRISTFLIPRSARMLPHLGGGAAPLSTLDNSGGDV